MTQSIFRDFLDLLFPPTCLLCKRDTSKSRFKEVCDSCLDEIRPLEPPFCRVCALPINSEQMMNSPVCPDCDKGETYFDRIHAPFIYTGNTVKMVRDLKFKSLHALARVMGELMLEHIRDKEEFSNFDLIAPIPVHTTTLKKRGFNQTLLIAKKIGKELGIPVRDILIKLASTPQEGLKWEERITNPLGSFDIKKGWKGMLKGSQILLIEDVVTTGSTVKECSRILKGEGADRVCILAFARVPRWDSL